MPYSQVDPQFEFYLRDNPGLSYADDSSPWLTRRVTRTFEKWLGRERLEAHYHALKNNHTSSQDFFRQALEISGVDLECDMSSLSKIPQNHPVIFIANHPFGVIDGLILCNIALRLNDNFRVVINSLLCQDRDLASHFLPIDFSGSKEASRRNIRAKQLANEALSAGIPLILFPSGMVSTANRFGFGKVHDAPWTTFVAKLVGTQKPVVVPVFFHGRNSRPFHIASHIAEPLRMAMLLRESLQRFNTRVKLTIGDPIFPVDYEHIASRQKLTEHLYGQVQALARPASDHACH